MKKKFCEYPKVIQDAVHKVLIKGGSIEDANKIINAHNKMVNDFNKFEALHTAIESKLPPSNIVCLWTPGSRRFVSEIRKVLDESEK